MAVPKKRKKLDEENAAQVKAESLDDSVPKPTKKTSSKPTKPRADKVDQAFEVMDKIEKKEQVQALEVHRFQPPAEQGIHIRFKLDLVNLDDVLNLGDKEKEKKENSIVFDFTIPYFWHLPLLNEVTRTVVQELKKMRIIQ